MTALDALLAELRPPPMSLGLADRVAAAALALPQGAPAQRSGPRYARRWLRRPLLVGGAALGLAFASAVAASLAGVELPRPVAAVIEKLPLVGKAAPEESPPARQAPRPTVQRAAPPPPAVAPAAPPQPVEAPPPLPPRLERRVERLERSREIVAERRAAGLPTPRADRMERMLERRRAAGLPTPRADRIERLLEQRRMAREAGRPDPVPPRAIPMPALPPRPVPPRAEPPPMSTVPDQPQAAPAAPSMAQQDAAALARHRAWLRQQQLIRLERLRRLQERRPALQRMQNRSTLARPGPRQ